MQYISKQFVQPPTSTDKKEEVTRWTDIEPSVEMEPEVEPAKISIHIRIYLIATVIV